MQKQVGDKECAQFVFKSGLPALEAYLSAVRLSAQGKLAYIQVTTIGAGLVGSHITPLAVSQI
jgi:hypothetical protein